MAIAADISVDTSGNIRWTGQHHDDTAPTYYTVLELHRFLQDLADDAQAASDDFLDITDDTPSDRSTDNIITLLGSYNIDDELAEHLYDGSITQGTGSTLTQYSGLIVVGSINDETNTKIQIVQENKVLNEFWKEVTNTPASLKDATANVLLKTLVKTVSEGVDIDDKKVRVFARQLGDTYAEFSATLGLGNSTAALFTNSDLNNTNNDATLAALTAITNVSEGYTTIDLNNGNGAQPYYGDWDYGGETVNEVYERAKWIQQAAAEEDQGQGADGGADFVIDNGTIVGQAQSFDPGANDEILVKIDANLKIGGGSPTGNIYCELRAHSGTFGTSSVPTGVALATSEPIDAAVLTSAYRSYSFRFSSKPQVGTTPPEDNHYDLQTGTDYVAVFLHANGDATNYVHIEGDTTSPTHDGNQSDVTGTTWTPASGEDLVIEVYTSPTVYGVAGELFRGITHEFDYSGTTGTVNELDRLTWGVTFTYSTEGGGGTHFIVGERLDFSGSSAVGRLIGIQDDGTTGKMVVDEQSGTIANTNGITGATSGRTATVNSVPVAGNFGTGLLLADDSSDTMWIQLLSGVAPASGQVLRAVEQEGTVTTSSVATSRAVTPVFIGNSTGSAIIGGFGVGFDENDLTDSDILTDLLNAVQNPPNNVTFTVSDIESGDRVLVAPRNGSVIDVGQYVLEAGNPLDQTNETSVVLDPGTETPIVTDIPVSTAASGNVCYLRIELDSGIYRRVAYTSFTGDTFTIASTDFSSDNASAGNNVYVAYIDVATSGTSEAVTQVFDSTRNLFVRVRDGGGTPIKTFESTTAQLLSTGGGVSAIRTTDA
jgi:hypothetical protein